MTTFESPNLGGHLLLGVGWRGSDAVGTGRIDISISVAQRLRAIAKEHVGKLEQRSARRFTPEVDIVPADEYAVLPTSSLAADDPTLRLLTEIGKLDAFGASELPSQPLLYYAIAFPGVALFLRKTNPHLSAGKGRFFTRLSDSLVSVDDVLFAFDEKVDVVITPSQVYISALNAFELVFKDDDFVTRSIPKWVKAVTDHLEIVGGGGNVLEQHARSNTRLRHRLESIAARGHLVKVSPAQVRAEIKLHGLDVRELMKGDQLLVTDRNVVDVLKLLNEDLFVGGLSGTPFEVDKKAPRSTR